MPSFGIVIIIVERAEREFVPKLIWKSELEVRGFFCLMAHRQFVKVALRILNIFNVKVILIDKSCQSYHLDYLSKLKGKGNYLVIAEEEAWVPFDIDDFFTRRLPVKAMSIIDEIWIPANAPIKDYIPNGYKCHQINHPRTLTTHAKYFESIRPKCLSGNDAGVILFVSSFGLLSSDIDFLDVMASECECIDLAKYAEINSDLRRRFDHFIEIIKQLLEHSTDVTVRVRPHPAEIGLWINMPFSRHINFDNDDYVKSIAHADIVVHSGSTVAFDVPDQFKSKVVYVAPPISQFYQFPKQASGHAIEANPKSTAFEIFEIFNQVRQNQINLAKEIHIKALLPDSTVLNKAEHIGLLKKFLFNVMLWVISSIFSVWAPIIFRGKDRELQKIKSFSKIQFKLFNIKGNYHV